MQIKDTDIYKLNYFTYNRAFTGSYGNMRYRLIRKKANTGISIYGGGKNRDDRMAESEIERI